MEPKTSEGEQSAYVEKTFNPDELRPLFRGLDDALGNNLSQAIGFQQLREAGIPTERTVEQDHAELLEQMEKLLNNIRAAHRRVVDGKPLLIGTSDQEPQVELQRVDYKEMNRKDDEGKMFKT